MNDFDKHVFVSYNCFFNKFGDLLHHKIGDLLHQHSSEVGGVRGASSVLSRSASSGPDLGFEPQTRLGVRALELSRSASFGLVLECEKQNIDREQQK